MQDSIGRRPQDQIRQSQIITTFGPGAMVDLPRYAVVIGGLEHWKNRGPEIFEERLVDKIKQALDLSAVRLYAPPPASTDPAAPMSGITAWLFPEWFIATGDEERGENYRSRPLIHRRQLTGGKYLGSDRRKYEVLPVRFVQACPNGHLSDLDWYGSSMNFKGSAGVRCGSKSEARAATSWIFWCAANAERGAISFLRRNVPRLLWAIARVNVRGWDRHRKKNAVAPRARPTRIGYWSALQVIHIFHSF
jgi:hypothetical protein